MALFKAEAQEVKSDLKIDNLLQENKIGTPEEKEKQEHKDELDEKQLKAIETTFDVLISSVINGVYLADQPTQNQLKPTEISKTKFSENMLNTVEHYFPDGATSHPLLALSISALALVSVVNSKKPVNLKRGRNDRQRQRKDHAAGRGDNSGRESASSIDADKS